MEILIERIMFTKLYKDEHLDNDIPLLHPKLYFMGIQYCTKKFPWSYDTNGFQ